MDFILRKSSVKASSISILSVLVLSALVGVVAFAPTVRAATPTLAFSTSSGQGALGDATFGVVSAATLVSVTGTGFPAGQDSISLGYITLGKAVSAANYNGLTLIRPSLASTATGTNCPVTSGGCVQADANGWFTAQFYVPEVQAGAYTIVAQYIPTGGSTTLTTGTPFTVNAAIGISNEDGAIYNSQVEITASGFGASETVSFSPTTMFTSAQYGGGTAFSSFAVSSTGATCSAAYPGTSPTGYAYTGRCSTGTGATQFLTNHKGGSVAITATGGTTSITASASYSISPSIAILNSATGVTELSIPTAAGSAKVEGFGFASSATFPANSLTLTVGGVTALTIMNSVTTDNFGYFVPTTFTWTQGLPEGMTTVGLNGTNYSFANANLQPGTLVGAAEQGVRLLWHGVLLASNAGGPAFILTDKTSYKANSDNVYLFGIGFTANSAFTATTYQPTNGVAATVALDGGSSAGATFGTTAASVCAACKAGPNGAFMAWLSSTANKLPDSFGLANTFTVSDSTPATGSVTIAVAPGYTAPSSSEYAASSGSSGATPFNRASRNTATGITVTGMTESPFGTPDTAFTVTLTSASGTVSTWATVSAACGVAPCYTRNGVGDYSFNLGSVPEVAGGTYTLTVTGTSSGNVASMSVGNNPIIIGAALSVTGGTTGTTVAFATSTTSGGAGVHGLTAGTSYSIMLDGPTGTSVGTFTATANGEVPPGTQFTLPAGSTGTHVVDLVAASTTTSAIAGAIAPRVALSAQYTGYAAGVTNAATSNTGTQGLTIGLIGAGTLSPNVGTPGTVVTVSANGLSPSTQYYVVLYNDISYASFTSTATGTVPAGVTFTFPNVPVAAGKETGDAFGVRISSTALHTGTGVASNATFILQSSMKLSATSAAAGQTLSVTASALAFGSSYAVIFNYQVNPFGTAFTGTTIGSLVGGADGSASGQVTVPSNAAAGTYVVQLARISPTTSALGVLANQLTLTIGAPSGVGTSTLTASGSATEASVSGQATVSQSFTNTASTSLSIYMWVSVKNSAGQTVGVFLGSATIAAGATTSIGAALFNLPSGTYTATVVCTTTSGIVVSSTSTTSSFSV